MADDKPEFTLDHYREMAEQWDRWRQLLAPQGLIATTRSLGPVRTEAFVAISRDEPVWRLAVAEAAYINVSAPRSAHAGVPATLAVVTNSLLLNRWQTEFPDFPVTAVHVARRPFDLVVQATPRVSQLLDQYAGLTAADFVCVDFCRKQHPEGGEALRQCVQACTRAHSA
jgi:hypothetical protein